MIKYHASKAAAYSSSQSVRYSHALQILVVATEAKKFKSCFKEILIFMFYTLLYPQSLRENYYVRLQNSKKKLR